MKQIDFKLTETYPDLFEVLQWKGSVDTINMTCTMMANGALSGPFTGLVIRTGGVSGSSTLSTFNWQKNVVVPDSAVVGSYKMEMQVIHAAGAKEIVDLCTIIKVSECG